jgi:hypothetical protein
MACSPVAHASLLAWRRHHSMSFPSVCALFAVLIRQIGAQLVLCRRRKLFISSFPSLSVSANLLAPGNCIGDHASLSLDLERSQATRWKTLTESESRRVSFCFSRSPSLGYPLEPWIKEADHRHPGIITHPTTSNDSE